MDEIIKNRGLGRRQRIRVTTRAFTARKQQSFLDALALTCNVARSAEHARIDKTTAYNWRAKDPAFAALWREAIEAAYDRLELLVLEHGGAGEALDRPDAERALSDGLSAPFDFDKAMSVLRQYRARRDAQPFNKGGRPPLTVSREDTNAALVKALAAVRKRLDAERDRDG